MQSARPSCYLEDYAIHKSLREFKNHLYLASNIKTNLPVVIKAYPCSPEPSSPYIRERNHLRSLNHKNIVKLHAYNDIAIPSEDNSQKFSYLAMEYLPLGDLCDHLINRGAFPEVLARTIFHQIIDAVSYLHDNSTAHMDLKVDNIMLDDNYNVKLIDFDQSVNFGTKYFGSRGTVNFRCPEVIKGEAADLRACDIYSLGVILFLLMTNRFPYFEVQDNDDNIRYDLHHKLMRSNPKIFWREHIKVSKDPRTLTPEFKSLIMGMLNEDPSERMSIEEIKKSSWFKGSTYCQKEYEIRMKAFLG